MNGYTELEMQLLNDFQHNFPLVSRPFAHIADRLQVSENSVLTHLWRLRTLGAVSRVGPVFSPGCIGASTLAALAVPQAQVEPMAEWISGLPEVNHNYQREHDYNLWFVVTAANEIHLQQVLDRIARHSHWPMLTLPLLERFHIDLGFDLNGVGRRPCTLGSSDRVQLDDGQVSLVAALQCGIPLVAEPFAEIGARLDMAETDVLQQIACWQEQGVIKRFGVVVRHHELGWCENAMAVWDVPDELASAAGKLAAQQSGVTLCYRRARQLPEWTYNLYVMVHGMQRDVVLRQVAALAKNCGMDAYPSRILFNVRRFKQHGARYVNEAHHG